VELRRTITMKGTPPTPRISPSFAAAVTACDALHQGGNTIATRLGSAGAALTVAAAAKLLRIAKPVTRIGPIPITDLPSSEIAMLSLA
jgi:hypothetical protein